MNSGRSIARAYRDAESPSTGTGPGSFRQLWLVGVLVLITACWPTAFRFTSEPAGQPLVGSTVTRPVGVRPSNRVGQFLERAHLHGTHRDR